MPGAHPIPNDPYRAGPYLLKDKASGRRFWDWWFGGQNRSWSLHNRLPLSDGDIEIVGPARTPDDLPM
jgi:hypothetical protein